MLSTEITYEYYQMLKNDRLSYIYRGSFDDEITAMILSLSEYNVEKIDEFAKLKKRIAFLMAECFQNIIRHKETDNGKTQGKDSVFITRNIGNVYYITSANMVENKRVADLQSKLDRINRLDHEELKSFYLDNLEQARFSDKGGAGLGLIEMARRSKQPLDYQFDSFDDEYSLFYLSIKLHGKGSDDAPDNQLHLTNINRDFHDHISNMNIMMVYKGDFSQDTIIPVLKMIESNLDYHSDHLIQKKRTFSVMTEMLQNISRHGKTNHEMCEGIFLIGLSNGKFVINTGNIVDGSTKESLTKKLESVRNMDRSELKNAYKKVLLDGEVSHLGGAGLGLITIARDTSEAPQYSFYKMGTDEYLFILDVRI